MKIFRWQAAILAALAGLALLAPRLITASSNYSYDTKVNYRVAEDGTAQVTQTYTVTLTAPRFYLTDLKLTTPSGQISQLSAAYSDGGNIPTKTVSRSVNKNGLEYNYQEVDVNFPRQLVGQGRTWSFTVTYTAPDLVDSKGSAHTVFVPALDSADSTSGYQATVNVPASFGQPHFIGAHPSVTGTDPDGRTYYTFAKSDLNQQSLTLAFGSATVYKVDFRFPLRNLTPWARTFTVTLPPDLNNQTSVVSSLNPKPANLHLDDDGNVLADYRLGPGQRLTVTTDVRGEVKYLDYDLGRSGTKQDIPADITKTYTKSTKYWPTNGPVAAAAAKLTDNNAPVINNVQAIYQYVINTLSYNPDKVKFNVRQGAAAALAHPQNAVCLEYSDLLIAMLRSQGIPAREAIGYAYSGSLKSSPSVSDSLHAWVEAYVPGVGWMTLDPTWGEKFDEFGHSDLDHFAFAVWGDRDSVPAAVMNGSLDGGYQYEDTQLSFLTTTGSVENAPASLKISRLVILPFLALEKISVKAPGGAVGDNNAISGSGFSLPLGSLAPGQQVTVWRPVAGGGWLSQGTAQLVRTGDSGLQVLASTQAQLSWWPLVLLVLLAAVGAAVATMLRLRLRQATDPKATIEPETTPPASTEVPTSSAQAEPEPPDAPDPAAEPAPTVAAAPTAPPAESPGRPNPDGLRRKVSKEAQT